MPDGYSLAICPHSPYIILDVDRHGKINGFNNIPEELGGELSMTLSYETKNHGRHFWFKYSGDKILANKASGLGIDLRTHKGYVVWYMEKDVRSYMHRIKETSSELNIWLEKLFSYK